MKKILYVFVIIFFFSCSKETEEIIAEPEYFVNIKQSEKPFFDGEIDGQRVTFEQPEWKIYSLFLRVEENTREICRIPSWSLIKVNDVTKEMEQSLAIAAPAAAAARDSLKILNQFLAAAVLKYSPDVTELSCFPDHNLTYTEKMGDPEPKKYTADPSTEGSIFEILSVEMKDRAIPGWEGILTGKNYHPVYKLDLTFYNKDRSDSKKICGIFKVVYGII